MWNPNEYDETSEGGGKAEPGIYPYKIDDSVETAFRTGTEGVKLTMLVGAFPDRDVKVFKNLFPNNPNALWVIKQLCDSVGADFNNPPKNAAGFINKAGKAKFVLNDRGYLEVDEFLPANANNTTLVPATDISDDLPF